jgi:hypothetical protein
MDKAILVIDMPDDCFECDFCVERSTHDRCVAAGKTILTLEKPDWCPLMPAPEEQFIWYDDARSDWERGYNNCLREIVGE